MKDKEEISGIRISGKKFRNDINFMFWKNEKTDNKKKNKKDNREVVKEWISLVYGRNASGKSSITNILQEGEWDSIENFYDGLHYFLLNDKEEIIEESNSLSFLIFNDNFIKKNINETGDSLLAIFIDKYHRGFYNLSNKILDTLNKMSENHSTTFYLRIEEMVVTINDKDNNSTKKEIKLTYYKSQKDFNIDIYIFKLIFKIYKSLFEKNNLKHSNFNPFFPDKHIYNYNDVFKEKNHILDYMLKRDLCEESDYVKKQFYNQADRIDYVDTITNISNLKIFHHYHNKINEQANSFDKFPLYIQKLYNFFIIQNHKKLDNIFLLNILEKIIYQSYQILHIKTRHPYIGNTFSNSRNLFSESNVKSFLEKLEILHSFLKEQKKCANPITLSRIILN